MSTDDDERVRDEHLVAAIAVVLTSGFAVENHKGDARIERVDGQFQVLTLEKEDAIRPVRDAFDDVHEAVRYYLDSCDG